MSTLFLSEFFDSDDLVEDNEISCQKRQKQKDSNKSKLS